MVPGPGSSHQEIRADLEPNGQLSLGQIAWALVGAINIPGGVLGVRK